MVDHYGKIDVRPIVRGVMVPCSWSNSGPRVAATDTDVVPSTTFLQRVDLSTAKRIRRDGLIFANTDRGMVEGIIPHNIIPDLETRICDRPGTDHGKPASGSIVSEFFGIPPSNSDCLFSAPLTIQWDLTSRCNLKCKHCYANANNKITQELSLEKILNLVDEASRIGVMALHILGGEPFARKDLVEVIQYACQRGLSCHVSSNGTLIKPRHASALKGLSNVTIDVSVDSTRPERHDWLRGQKGAYDKAIRGIRLMQQQGVLVGSTCTIHADTLDEMSLIAQQAVDLGLYRLQFLFVSPVGRAQRFQDELLLSEDGRARFKSQFHELVEKYAGTLHIDSPVVAHEPVADEAGTVFAGHGLWLIGCLAGIDKMAIRSDGSVVLCPQLKTAHGNVQVSTLEDIWSKLHAQRLKTLGKGCATCAIDGYCGGGCPAPDICVNEVAPCYGRAISPVTMSSKDEPESASALWCPTDCLVPCLCPTHCSLPCRCPTWCALPCNCPTDCSCPTFCPVPCSCPMWCSSPCNFPCSCPTYCPSPCPFPCSCPTHCPFPCSCPTFCPIPR